MDDKELQYLRQQVRLWGVSNGLKTLQDCCTHVEPAWLGEEMYRVIISMQDALKDLEPLSSLAPATAAKGV